MSCSNFPAKLITPIPEKYAQKIAKKSTVFTRRFTAKFAPKTVANFPQNRPFFHEFDSQKPAKFDFFP